jgi:tetratricopeptide (TPR) repeat protein
MPRYFLIRLCCFFLGGGAALATNFDTANEQFKAADFTAAVSSYEKALSEAGPNAATYYNLGNAHLSLKQYGPAILAYERARLLNPRASDCRANLSLARKDAGVYEDSGRHAWVEAALTFMSLREWSLLLVGAAAVLGLLFFCNGLIRVRRTWLFSLSILSSLLILVAASVLWIRRGESLQGVIIASEARILLSPFEKAETLASPSPGRMVRIGQKKGDFYYVEVPGVSSGGWVASREVAPIIPANVQ